MSKYFTSVYKNYYDKITSSNDIDLKCNELIEKIDLFLKSIKNNNDLIIESTWNEDGKKTITSNYLINVMDEGIKLREDVFYKLNYLVKLLKEELYPMLTELKEKDSDYCRIEEEIQDGYDNNIIVERKNDLDNLRNELISLANNIDRKILEIKKLFNYDDIYIANSLLNNLNDVIKNEDENNSFIEELKQEVKESKDKIKEVETKKEEEQNNKVVNLSILGGDWKVVDTAISPEGYAKIADKIGIRQNSNIQRYSDYCLAFSYVHASNMYNGCTTDNAESAYNWRHASEFENYYNDSKEETLKVIYDEVMSGKPVVMQVNGNKTGTSRHFVTVVGIKDGVDKNNIKEQDLLILDSWDGKLERMDTSTSRYMTTGKQTHKSYSGYYLRLIK